MSLFNLLDTSTGVHAPIFPSNLKWLNLPAGRQILNPSDLKGKVILVDFWTYSCINCQRTLPYLKKWWEKYSSNGLVIIGVHTPEFEFEKSEKNVKQALDKYLVSWPVVLDNDYLIWNSYANKYWPAKYLVDHKGKIIYSHFGEGNYLETELRLQEALKDAGFEIGDKTVGSLVNEKYQSGQTPELYLGSIRGSVLPVPKETFAENLDSDQIYIEGNWTQDKEYLEHSKDTKELVDILILKYRAKKVYLVCESMPKSSAHLVMESSSKEAKIYLTLDGVPVDSDTAGESVEFDQQNRAFINVKFSTLYNLIETDSFGEHILRISTLDKGVKLFAFTFGS